MDPRSLDDWLDRSVLGGYTSIGFRLRAARWGDSPPASLAGSDALVTGASSGLGEAACEGLARAGATVHMLVRDAQRGARARERVAARLHADGHPSPPGDLKVVVCDLSDLSSVRAFAREFAAPGLRILVNNAGVMAERRQLNRDGLELTFATNVVGPLLLTSLLMPRLRANAPARVITVSSGGMYTSRLRPDDLQRERAEFSPNATYAHSKRAEVVLTELAAQRCTGGVSYHCMHPGWVDTPGIRDSLPGFYRLTRPLLRNPHQGADTIVWLATSAEAGATNGLFWHDRRARPTHRVPWTHESESDRERLWQQCLALAGLENSSEPRAAGEEARAGRETRAGERARAGD